VLGMLLLAMGIAGSARADQTQDDELKARKLFGAGNFKGALDIYTDLYARKPHPTYTRNIGRCYQNLGEPERAITAFREYLRTSRDLTPEARTEVEGYIREMEDLERSRAPAPPAPAAAIPPASLPPPRLEAPPPSASASARSSGESPLTLQSPPPAEGSGSILGHWWFWTAAGVVAAGVVVGIVIASSSGGTPTKPSDLGPMRAQF
jgi:hypothetical protein